MLLILHCRNIPTDVLLQSRTAKRNVCCTSLISAAAGLELHLILIANMHLVSMMFIGAVRLSFFLKIFAREKRANAFPKRQIVIASVRIIGL